MSDDWRPIIAALANPDTRAVFAEVVLGADEPGAGLSPSRRGHALGVLRTAGVIDETGMLDAGAFTRVLAAAPRRERPTGVQRFLDADGRIDRYPSRAGDREALLAHVAAEVLVAGDTVSERELTDRLRRFTDDPAALRRHLVDSGLVERTRSGSEYALTPTL